MHRMFSENLIRKAKTVLEEKCGRALNDDEIEMMLDRLSQLGMLFVKNILDKKDNPKNNALNRKKI